MHVMANNCFLGFVATDCYGEWCWKVFAQIDLIGRFWTYCYETNYWIKYHEVEAASRFFRLCTKKSFWFTSCAWWPCVEVEIDAFFVLFKLAPNGWWQVLILFLDYLSVLTFSSLARLKLLLQFCHVTSSMNINLSSANYLPLILSL